MKKYILKISLLLSISILIFSCDKVENPVEANSSEYNTALFPGNYVTDYAYPSFSPNASPHRNVLLEDYTGHKCGNCPSAAVEAKNIETNSNGRVIVTSIHAGQGGVSNFQEWSEEGDYDYPKYSTNLTSKEGIQYAIEIDGGCPANPTGMVSRKSYGTSNTLWIGYSTWSQAANEIINTNDVLIDLQLVVNYFPETNGLFLHAFADTKIELNDNYSIVYMLINKKIISWQKDYSLVEDNVEEYEHHNVHIENLNGTYGEVLFPSGTSSGESIQKDVTYKIASDIYDEDLAIIAYIQNDITYEIVQVAIADVK